MSDIKFLLKISRPRFWIYVFGPYLIGLAAAMQDFADLIRPEILLFGVYFLFPANLLIYGVNDVFDYEIDRLNPKKHGYETLVTPDQRRFIFLVILIFNLPFTAWAIFYFTGQVHFLFGFILLTVFYSAPPVRAKTRPVIDSAFNILYIFPGLFAFALLSGGVPSAYAALGAGAWTMAMHAYSAIPDISADQKAKIETVATRLGPRGTLILCFICYAFAAAAGFRFLGSAAIMLGIPYLAMTAITYRFLNTDRLFALYRIFPVLNTLTGLILFFLIAYSKIKSD